MTPNAAEVAQALGGKKVGNHWRCRCPAHADQHPSLDVADKGGNTVWFCRAGCPNDAVHEALVSKGLWPPNGNGVRKREWTIKSAGGSVQAVKHRLDPGKSIRWEPAGVKPKEMLYLAEQTQNGYDYAKPVYVCEGEPDADAARRFGLQAVGTVGGASACPSKETLACLAGFPVVLWPDYDVPGQNHMQEIARVLGRPTQIVDVATLWAGQAPAGQGAADLLALPAGGLPVHESLQPRRAITVMLDTVEPEEVSWLWHPYVPLGKLTLLEGDPGTGKSFLALRLAAAVSHGGDMPGVDRVDQGKALYMVSEDGVADTLVPRLRAMGAAMENIGVICGTSDGKEEGAITFDDMDLIEERLAEIGPKLLIVDPIQAYLGSGVDMNHAEQTRPILFALSRLAERYGTAVLVVRHWRKTQGTGKSAAIYRGMGSIDIVGAARSALAVALDPKDETGCRRLVRQVKNNLTAHGPDLQFRLDPGYGFRWVDSFMTPPAGGGLPEPTWS